MYKTIIILLLFAPSIVFSQWRTIIGKYNYTDSLKFAKYRNNLAMDSVLSVDTSGKLILILKGGGSGSNIYNSSGELSETRVIQTTTNGLVIVNDSLAPTYGVIVGGLDQPYGFDTGTLAVIFREIAINGGDYAILTATGFVSLVSNDYIDGAAGESAAQGKWKLSGADGGVVTIYTDSDTSNYQMGFYANRGFSNIYVLNKMGSGWDVGHITVDTSELRAHIHHQTNDSMSHTDGYVIGSKKMSLYIDAHPSTDLEDTSGVRYLMLDTAHRFTKQPVYVEELSGNGDGILTVDNDGKLIFNSQIISSGYYIPDDSAVLNIAGITVDTCYWIRVGDNVTITGSLVVEQTAAVSNTDFELTLPIASNLSYEGNCPGIFTITTQNFTSATQANPVTDKIRFLHTGVNSTDPHILTFSVSYPIK